ncbi:putative C6 finger domain-containing protein [Rosellinia necatrix]|uniref:Putative C6 finger domain-containing protein n=1 Tax=Rosellinia necatrix TaxID=77044 RepID=A0A1W2TR00_ROSNE|nr:putative C6 finger domain-containing protein [Rosellinia necatrix]
MSYSPNPRTDPPTARAERTPTDNLLQKPSPEPNHQVRTEADDQYRSRPSKRRSVSNGHLAFGSSDFGSPSLRLGPSADMPFGTSKEPSFSQNGPFDMDIGSFSLSSASDPCEQVCGTTPMMDLLLEAVPDEETSVSTFLLGPTWGEPVTPSDTKATDSREDDLHRLSELNSRIVRDFKGVNSIATADIISTLTRCELGSQACAVGPPVPKSPIGRVLESSQLFLELLQGLKPDQNQYAESECSYSEFQDENDFSHLPRLTPDGQAFADMTTRDSTTHRHDNVTAMLQSSNCLASVDMPMTLIILTCYTLLLQTYETIFSRIHESLFSRERLSRQLVPPVLPGLHIGGFYLNKHQDLQMDILISLSCRMLERIEEELGINVISESQDHTSDYMSKKRGLLEASYASAILEVMFKQKGLGHSQSYRGRRIAMVKETMENIRHMFKQKY